MVSSTVYNEIPSEPTVIVVPVFDTEPDTGLGVDLGERDWAAPGLVAALRKARPRDVLADTGVHAATVAINVYIGAQPPADGVPHAAPHDIAQIYRDRHTHRNRREHLVGV